jgi:Methyltransferase domain
LPHWLLKAGTQKVISWLPRSDSVNYAFQRNVTRTAQLRPEWFNHKLDQAARHLRNWSVAGHDDPPRRLMELGTGWHPVVPVALALAGVDEVVSVDRSSLVRAANVGSVLRMFGEANDDGRLRRRLTILRPDRLDIVRSLAADPEVAPARLVDAGVTFLVRDARNTGLPDDSINLFTSNNTFEHIPPNVLLDILVEMRRLAAPHAVLSHFVDLSDHYSHFDRSLSPYNFLRYSEPQWRLLNNRIVFQNRLRVSSYRRLFRAAGLELVDEEDHTPQPVPDIRELRLPAALRSQPAEEVLVTHAWFTAAVGTRPPP